MSNDWYIATRVGADEVQALTTPAELVLARVSFDWQWVVLRDGKLHYALSRQELAALIDAHKRAHAPKDLPSGALQPTIADVLDHADFPPALVIDRDVWAREIEDLADGVAGGKSLRIIVRVAGEPLAVWALRPHSDVDRARPGAIGCPQPTVNPAPASDAGRPEFTFNEAGLPGSPGWEPIQGEGFRPDHAGDGGGEAFPDGIEEIHHADAPDEVHDDPIEAADEVQGEDAPAHAIPDMVPDVELEAEAFPEAAVDAVESAPVIDEVEEAPRWVNALIEDHEAAQPLAVGDTYTLAISIDAMRLQSPEAVGGVRASELTRDGDRPLLLTVSLSSNDFTITDPKRSLKIGRDGLSAGKARFDIEPLRLGLGRLTAVLHRENNFVQQLDISLQVGPGVVEPAAVVSTGRPIAASRHLSRRDIGLSIQPSATGGFDCVVWGSTSANVKLPISAGELDAEIDAARAALLRVVTAKRQDGARPFQAGIEIDAAARDAALAAIALAGYTLFQKLFFHPAADRQCQELGEWLIAETNQAQDGFTLQILARDFPVPWAMLYLAPEWKDGDIDFERFLGMKLVIEQIPLRNDKFGRDTRIPGDPGGLSVSLNLNTDIDAQMQTNVVAAQETYWRQAVAACPAIRLRKRTQAAELLAALNDDTTDDQIVYFFCHAESIGLQGGGGPGHSNLTLSGSGSLDLANLAVQAPAKHKLGGAPLVFINACESGRLSPLFYNGFVPYFMSKGARGVIGTECKVPARFAAAWAGDFFDGFLAGGSLGEIVLGLRRNFYLRHGNPLGLLYGVHCSADTQIDPLPLHP